jgi:uncharacterized membrane protein YfcA
LPLIVIFAFMAFALSASAGMGGSLIMVPALALFFDGKQGIALAALLLACNNVWKVILYKNTIPCKKAAMVVACTMAGTVLGAKLMVSAPSWVVDLAIIVSISGSFAYEIKTHRLLPRKPGWIAGNTPPFLAFFAGATSGFSGSSGPLKGVAIRNLKLDRFHLVGAASVVSLAGDFSKTWVYYSESLLDGIPLSILVCLLPLMPLASMLGRRINREIGENAFATLFWLVMGGYCIRLIIV